MPHMEWLVILINISRFNDRWYGIWKNEGGGTATDMAGMMMGMNIANQMMNQMNQNTPNQPAVSQDDQSHSPQQTAEQKRPNFCPNCGTKTGNANFCSNCGQKLI